MKVAILCQPFDLVLPPEQSSVGIWTFEVAKRLTPRCELTILARRGRGAPARSSGEWGRLEALPMAPLRLWGHASRLWSTVRPSSPPLVGQPLYAFDYLWAALRRLRKLDPDVVHLQNIPHFGPAVRQALPRAAILLHMHCDWLVELPPETIARSLAAVDSVIGCSAHIIDAAAAKFASSSRRFAVVPNGAPPAESPQLRSAAEPGRVVFVGRVSPEKGVHTLLEAWPEVLKACPGAHLDIVGPQAETPRDFLVDLSTDTEVRALARFYPGGKDFRGSYHAALQALLPTSLASTVTFPGHLSHAQVMERMARACVLANPSLSESFGMSLVEALSLGIPVVATRAGGMTEILEATRGGLLVPKNDPRRLAEALIALLADPRRAHELGRFGGERAAALYSWDRIAGLTYSAYLEALNRRNGFIAMAS